MFEATDDDDPEYEGDVPCTTEAAPTAPALVDVVLVRQWLVDSGSAMDLIDERAAEPFSHFIEDISSRKVKRSTWPRRTESLALGSDSRFT